MKFTGKTSFNKVAAYKKTLAQVFSCEYCKIFKNTSFRIPLLDAWSKIRTASLKSATFQFQLFLTTLDIMGFLYIVKRDIHIKIFVAVSIHVAIQTLKHLNRNKKKNSLQWYVLNRRSFPAFTEWVVVWNCFLNDLIIKNTSLFNFYKKKIKWQLDVKDDTRFKKYASILRYRLCGFNNAIVKFLISAYNDLD